MSLKLLQVTLGAGATQFQTASQPCQLVIVQNNAAAVMRVGDSTVSATKGIALAASPSAPVTIGPGQGYALDLNQLWVIGTATEVLDVLYV